MRAMKSLAQRVEEAVAAGFSVTDLARAAGTTSAAVSHWRMGRTQKLRAESAVGLSKATGWSAAWWSTGKGDRDMKAPSSDGWPFRMIKREAIEALDAYELGALEHAMLQVLERRLGESSAPKGKRKQMGFVAA